MPTNFPPFRRPPLERVATPTSLCRMKPLRRRVRAFSLIELLTALTVFSLLIIILAAVAQSVSDVWVLTQKRTSRQQSSRAVMDFIARDLQCALPPIVRGSQTSLQMVQNPASLAPPPDNYRSGDTLFWQAPATTDTSDGDIAILGYFIRWTPTHKAMLCRLFVPPETTAELIKTSPTDWVNSDVISTWAPADSSRNYLGLMSENVVGFWAEALDAYGNVIAPHSGGATFDSRLGYINSQGTALPPGSLPTAIRVSIATLDARSAARLDTNLQARANSVTNAEAFVTSVLADTSLKAIHAGVHAHTATITLINSR